MIFDNDGLPKDVGATDYMDSARLAGLMAIFKMDKAPSMLSYIVKSSKGEALGVRHPFEGIVIGEMPSNNPYNFTRDQLICLAAGLHAQGHTETVKSLYESAKSRGYRAQNTEADYPGTLKKFPNGADLLTPSHMNHLRMCANLKPGLLGKAMLMLDILYSGLFKKMSEPNQLICMLIVAGPIYVRMWKKINSKWKDAIKEYWSGWRQEPELADHMIGMLEKI